MVSCSVQTRAHEDGVIMHLDHVSSATNVGEVWVHGVSSAVLDIFESCTAHTYLRHKSAHIPRRLPSLIGLRLTCVIYLTLNQLINN